MTGAIFWLTRPATIIRSAWRGEPRKTSMPKRARSQRGPPVDIISIEQHASPKVAGHMEPARARPATVSSDVRITPPGRLSWIPIGLALLSGGGGGRARDQEGAAHVSHSSPPRRHTYP